MADVKLEIGGRDYIVTCRDGEEAHLLDMAALIHAKSLEAQTAVGGLSEVRQLLFAALLLADELYEARNAVGKAVIVNTHDEDIDASSSTALAHIADRIEAIATALERATN